MTEYLPLTDEQLVGLQRLLFQGPPTEPAEVDAFLWFLGYDPEVLAEKFRTLADRLIRRGPMDNHVLVSEEWVASVPKSAADLAGDVRQVVADRNYWQAEAERLRAENAKLVESRRCWRMDAVGFGKVAKMYKAVAAFVFALWLAAAPVKGEAE